MSTATEKAIKANPGPLGLLGFGMTTVLLNIHNAGFTANTPTIIAMGIALGGLAQIIAGILEFQGGNTFAGTAFTAYGLFWWSLVLIWKDPLVLAAGDGANTSFSWYLMLWGFFTTAMFIGTLTHNRATQVVFFTLAVLFFGLAADHFTNTTEAAFGHAVGYWGILCGASAIYNAFAQIINGEHGRQILPLG
ncbi:MAG: acetate uptake transporter [Micrococcales bacterium]|nr:acetate uptake transporter [Micrococcales bacterium]